MLNRTNRTLSANRNGLNLGTRSLAIAGGSNGIKTLRDLHAHGIAMRAGMYPESDPAIRSSGDRISVIPGSTPVVPWPVVGFVVRPRVGDPVTRRPRTPGAALAARFTLAGPSHAQAHSPQGCVKHGRDAFRGGRPVRGKVRGAFTGFAARSAAAATAAAAGG